MLNQLSSRFRLASLVLAIGLLPSIAGAQAPVARLDSTGSAPLRVGDLLRIKVWPDSSLGGDYTIEETGLVYLPVIGEYRAAGRPIGAVRADLRELYGRELKFPVVNVTPRFRVSVLGAVQSPGLYYADATQTWFDVISDAGGFATNAARDAVHILRDGRTFSINASQGELESVGSLDVAVQSGDRIIVPARRNWQSVLTVTQTIVILGSVIYQISR